MHEFSEEITNIELNKNNEKLYVKSIGLKEFDTQLIVFHDVGEYHQRYSGLSNYLSKKSIGTTLIDMRGHGLSSGTRGHSEGYEELVSDYKMFWKTFKNRYEKKSTFVLGHGVGGLLALCFMLNVSEVSGAILVNPTIKYKDESSYIEKYMMKNSFLNKLKISYKSLEKVTSQEHLSRSFGHDPLINKKISVGMHRSITGMTNELKRLSYFVTRPILFQMGELDDVVEVSKSELFASSFDKNNIEVIKYPNFGHEIFNEIDRDKVFKDIYNWLYKNS
jgi:alpha-beta hydrolase superfamily lysophospholipase